VTVFGGYKGHSSTGPTAPWALRVRTPGVNGFLTPCGKPDFGTLKDAGAI